MSLSLRTLYDTVSRGLFGEAEAAEAERPVIGLDMLSSFLPYRVYEPATRLYLNARSTGFILNVAPLVGADERTGELLGQFFSEGLPAGACVQIVHWASPRISRTIAPWFAPRYLKGGVYEAIARRRTDTLYQMVWASGSGTAPFHARHHQLLISVGMPGSANVSREELGTVRESLVGVLRALDVPSTDVSPPELIAFLDDLTSPTTASGDDPVDYNPLDPIATQALRRDIEIQVEENRLRLLTERFRPTGRLDDGAPEIGEIYPDRFDVRHFGVRAMPQRWAPWDMARLIGDLFTDKLRFPCPAATYLCLVYPDQDAAAAKAGMKFLRSTSLSEGRSARYVPRLAEQAAEWREVQAQMQEGKRLVRGFFGLTSFSPDGQGDAHERTIKSLYKAAGWATKTLIELQQRRIVTVGLSGLVREFVAEESRRASSPEAATARTRLYLAALDRAVRELERDGAVVLVRESVLGAAVTDRTTLVRARVAQAMQTMP